MLAGDKLKKMETDRERAESTFDPSDFYLYRGGSPSTTRRGEYMIAQRDESALYIDHADRHVPQTISNLRDLANTPFTIVGDDQFFRHLYKYHQGSGLICIILNSVCYVLTVLFTILFSTFLLTCVDWKGIHEGRKTKFADALYPRCEPEGGRNVVLTLTFLVFIVIWTVMTIRTVYYLLRMKRIHDLWTGVLGLSSDVQWVTWQMVIDSYHERIDQTVDSHYIVSRIMRWDNYLIAMLMKDVFGWDGWDGIFTKVLEKNVKKCINSALFRDDGILIRDVLLYSKKREYVRRLRKSFFTYGLINLIFLPFVFSALLIFFIYRHVGEYHKNPRAMGMFSFTQLAKWKLCDFNELPHVYNARLCKAHPKIIEYLGQFVNESINIVFKFVSFVLGSTLMILVAVSFFYPDVIISLFLVEKPIIFYVGVLGILFAMVQNNTVDAPQVYEPDEKFDELMHRLHAVPTKWANMSTQERYYEIRKLFRYKWMVLGLEIVSVLYVPLLLLFWMPSKCDNIVDFFRENSVHVDKMGIVCSCTMFDANPPLIRTKSDEDDDVESVTSSIDRKVSTSAVNFKESYPTWDPVRFKRTTVDSQLINQEYEDKVRLSRMRRERDDGDFRTTDSGDRDHISSLSRALLLSQQTSQDDVHHSLQSSGRSYEPRSASLNASSIIDQMSKMERGVESNIDIDNIEQDRMQQQQLQQEAIETGTGSLDMPFPLNLTRDDEE